MVYLRFLIFLGLIILSLSNCSEKITYSGKIINNDLSKFSKLDNKNNVIKELGQPNFIDPIENKYYYFLEKYKYKNIFDKNIENRIILVFDFNPAKDIISFNSYDLDDQKDIKFTKETTPNNLLERGLVEKVFGGVGKTYVHNTP